MLRNWDNIFYGSVAHGGVSVWLFPSWQSDAKAYEQSLCLRCLCVMVWFCLSLVDMSASVCDFAGCVSVPMCRRFCLCLDRCACVCVCFVSLHSVCITVCVCVHIRHTSSHHGIRKKASQTSVARRSLHKQMDAWPT